MSVPPITPHALARATRDPEMLVALSWRDKIAAALRGRPTELELQSPPPANLMDAICIIVGAMGAAAACIGLMVAQSLGLLP